MPPQPLDDEHRHVGRHPRTRLPEQALEAPDVEAPVGDEDRRALVGVALDHSPHAS
jgi:hypothetical protein